MSLGKDISLSKNLMKAWMIEKDHVYPMSGQLIPRVGSVHFSPIEGIIGMEIGWLSILFPGLTSGHVVVSHSSDPGTLRTWESIGIQQVRT